VLDVGVFGVWITVSKKAQFVVMASDKVELLVLVVLSIFVTSYTFLLSFDV
jgi:hypothetical protein